MTNDAHIFVSYAHEDLALLEPIVEALEAGGLRCWYAPRNIPAGASYPDEIATAIAGASTVLFLFTDRANHSEWIARELERAVSRKKKILVLKLGDAVPSPAIELLISSSQWVGTVAPDPSTDEMDRLRSVLAEPVARIRTHARRRTRNRALVAALSAGLAIAGAAAYALATRHPRPTSAHEAASTFFAALDAGEFKRIYDEMLAETLRASATREILIGQLSAIRQAEGTDARMRTLALDREQNGVTTLGQFRQLVFATSVKSAKYCEHVYASPAAAGTWLVLWFGAWAAPPQGCIDEARLSGACARAKSFFEAIEKGELDAAGLDAWLTPIALSGARDPYEQSLAATKRLESGTARTRTIRACVPGNQFGLKLGSFASVQIAASGADTLLEETTLEELAPGEWKIANFGAHPAQ